MRVNIQLVKIFLLVFIVTLFTNTFVFAAAENNANIDVDNAGKIAVWFIANNIGKSIDCTWGQNTRISKIVNLYDEKNNITGFSFELKDGEIDNGYIVVSGDSETSIIKEYAFSGKPLFYNIGDDTFDKVYFTAPFEYFVEKNKKITSLKKKDVEFKNISNKFKHNSKKAEDNKKFITKAKEDKDFKLNEWMCGYQGQISGQSGYGGITDPYTYVNDRYGTGWSYNSGNFLSATAHLMSEFESNANNCTLTAITTCFEYQRSIGQSGIPSSTSTLYTDVQTIAKNYGYTASAGTDPTYADDIVTDLWHKYNHSTGRGNNDYVCTWSTVTSEIDQNRPFLTNIAFGYYANHTITVTGYCVYTRNWYDNNKEFLRVFDGWTTSTRYIDWDVLSYSTFGSFTKVFPS